MNNEIVDMQTLLLGKSFLLFDLYQTISAIVGVDCTSMFAQVMEGGQTKDKSKFFEFYYRRNNGEDRILVEYEVTRGSGPVDIISTQVHIKNLVQLV